MQEVTITLAGQEYQVQKLPYKHNKAWRDKHDAVLRELIDTVGDLTPVVDSIKVQLDERDSLEELKASDIPLSKILGVVSKHLGGLANMFIEAPDIALDGLCDFAPAIAKDRSRIEEAAFDDEIVRGFVEVLQLAYPLVGQLMASLSTIGQTAEEET